MVNCGVCIILKLISIHRNRLCFRKRFFYFYTDPTSHVAKDEPRQELVQKQAAVGAVCIVPGSMFQGHQESNDAAADNHIFEFEGKIRPNFALTGFVNLSLNGKYFILFLFTKIIVCERK